MPTRCPRFSRHHPLSERPSNLRVRVAKRKAQGTSLIELTVASAVLLLILGVAYTLMIFGTRYLREANARLDCQREAVRVLADLSRELRQSSHQSVHCATIASNDNPKGLVFASAHQENGELSFDPAGKPIWQRLICYRNEGGDLLRCQEPLVTPNANIPKPLTMGRTTAYFSAVFSQPNSNRRLAREVTVFDVRTIPNPTRVNARIVVTRLSGQFSVEVQTQIAPAP